jgi:putative Holliday junction resolvase
MKSFSVQHLDAVWPQCPQNARLLGIDHGTKTLGLALSDPTHSMATPLKTIMRGKFEADVKALEGVIKDYGVEGLIIGWPLSMGGKAGPRAQSVKDYLVMLTPRLKLWWAVYDERLTSDAANNLMAGEMGLTFAKRDKAVDALAAQVILQGALDFMCARRQNS